jgi:hypothetical protein
MTIRDTLLGNVTTALTGTSVSVSSELPFDGSGIPLHIKNKRVFYITAETQDISTVFATLDRNDVFQNEVNLTGYICVDAKNLPTDMDAVIDGVLLSRQSVDNQSVNECSVTPDLQDDMIVYTFVYRFVTIN